MNSRKGVLVILLLLFVMMTAAAEDLSRPMGCRRGTPRPASMMRRAHSLPWHCGGDFYKGTRRQLVVLVAFKDRPFKGDEDATLQQWDKIFNTQNLSEEPFYGSVRDYFYAQSYGQFELVFDLQYVQLNDSCKKYRSTKDEDENSQYLVDDALDQLLLRNIDWSLYDWNGDGFINQLLFVYAGKGSSYGGFGGDSNSIWPHQWRMSEHFDLSAIGQNLYREPRYFDQGGKTYAVDSYCAVQEIGNRGGYESFGVICHEYTHCFGFPDFYYQSTKYVGSWDLMDSGNYCGDGYCPVGYSAHERWQMGWLEPVELTASTTVANMPPLSEEGQAYLIRNDGYPNEYYIVENRQPSRFDAKLPGAGVVIFHIDYDESIWTSFIVCPNNPQTQRYTIFPANNMAVKSQSGWAYPYQDNNSLTDTSQPAALLLHARNDSILLMSKPVTNIAVSDEGLASFDFMKDASAIQTVYDTFEAKQQWYDLQGRQLPGRPQRKGLYIVDGRKVVVR